MRIVRNKRPQNENPNKSLIKSPRKKCYISSTRANTKESTMKKQF